MLPTRIAILGTGDLGVRLATLLAETPSITELVLVGRATDGATVSRLLTAGGQARVRYQPADLSDRAAIEAFLRRERPDVLVHSASLMSPWVVPGLVGETGTRLRAAGFGAQLPAQLPLILAVMEAVREVGFTGPVINCSYPDVTNAILDKLGLAPTIGIGNVGIILRLVLANLRHRRLPGTELPSPVRVVAHHAHVTPVTLGQRAPNPGEGPLVYLGETGVTDDDIAYLGGPLPDDRRLNALAASAARDVIIGVSQSAYPYRTSAPGPLGLPGGYPVVLQAGRVDLDLPEHIDLESCLSHNMRGAARDGIQDITADGTVIYMPHAIRNLAALHPRLADPLPPRHAHDRYRILKDLL